MTEPQEPSEGIEIFFSYSHKDEELRDELEKHLSILKHRKLISAWHDREIGAGEEWKGEIDEHLNSAKIVLLLISSDFLASKYCYDIEMKRAIERHDSGEARVIPIILRHAYWEGSPFSKLQALPANAEPVKDGSWRSIDAAFKDVAEGLEKVIISLISDKVEPDPTLAKNDKDPKTIVVDQMHRGDFATITDAIAAAAPGSRILVRSGVYDEALIIDKPLEIIGEGKLGDVIIRGLGKGAIIFKTSRGKLSNFMVRQNDEGQWYAVDIAQGCLELSGCDITSDSEACIAVHGNAYPRIIDNKIHDGKNIGIVVYDNGQGVIEDNDICNNGGEGILIRDRGNPTAKHNNIHDGNDDGIWVGKDGRGFIEYNNIFGNKKSGIRITSSSNPIIRHNKIYDGEGTGISVHDNGKCVIEENEINLNKSFGVRIADGGNPLIRFNKINKNKSWAFFISNKGSGIIEDNDIRDNDWDAWYISEDSKDLVKHARNLEK
jgi:parallel beta-helix repeat protein